MILSVEQIEGEVRDIMAKYGYTDSNSRCLIALTAHNKLSFDTYLPKDDTTKLDADMYAAADEIVFLYKIHAPVSLATIVFNNVLGEYQNEK